jgi:hypothetical protein
MSQHGCWRNSPARVTALDSDEGALEWLSWGPAFAQQIDVEALTTTPPVRVVTAIEDGSLDSARLPALRQRYMVASLMLQRAVKLLLVEVSDFHLGLLPNELAGVNEGVVPSASQGNLRKRRYSGRSLSS